MSPQARLYNVVALAFVVCAWLVTAAMHLHLQDEHAGAVDSAHCAHCLALSTGAAPAPEYNFPIVIVTPSVVLSFDDVPAPSQSPRSSYLSRGPPAV